MFDITSEVCTDDRKLSNKGLITNDGEDGNDWQCGQTKNRYIR